MLSLVPNDVGSTFYADRVASLGGPVLVLGAGDGRIAWELALRDLQVTAADPSEVLVQSAEDRRAHERPEVSARLRVVRSDVRSLRLQDRFRVVIAPQNALGLMTTRGDLEAALATVKAHLEPTGTFLLDLINPPALRSPHLPDAHDGAGPSWYRPVFVPHLRERRRAQEPSASHDGLRRLRVHHFTPKELDAALRDAGFEAFERYGAFDGRPFAPEDPLQIVVAHPRA